MADGQLCCEEDLEVNSVYGFFRGNKFFLRHEAGFFSMCTTALFELARARFDVEAIDVTHTFNDFKDVVGDNVWHRFFKAPRKNLEVLYKDDNHFSNHLFHHDSYEELNHESVKDLLAKYFEPSAECINRSQEFKDRYAIDLDQTIVICYRGTDKHTEVTPSPIEKYIEIAKIALLLRPECRVLVQTDQKQIRDRLMAEFGDKAFYIDEMPVTETDVVMHKVLSKDKAEFGVNLLAAVLLMSQCRYLITHTGNVAYWTVLLRGHSDRLIQL